MKAAISTSPSLIEHKGLPTAHLLEDEEELIQAWETAQEEAKAAQGASELASAKAQKLSEEAFRAAAAAKTARNFFAAAQMNAETARLAILQAKAELARKQALEEQSRREREQLLASPSTSAMDRALDSADEVPNSPSALPLIPKGMQTAAMANTKKHSRPKSRMGSYVMFPRNLHDLLDNSDNLGYQKTISWMADGKSFRIHEPWNMDHIIKTFFNQNKFKSFLRQLQNYGFSRVLRGRDRGVCKHPLFIRGQRDLSEQMKRTIHLRKAAEAAAEAKESNKPTSVTTIAPAPKTTAPPPATAAPGLFAAIVPNSAASGVSSLRHHSFLMYSGLAGSLASARVFGTPLLATATNIATQPQKEAAAEQKGSDKNKDAVTDTKFKETSESGNVSTAEDELTKKGGDPLQHQLSFLAYLCDLQTPAATQPPIGFSLPSPRGGAFPGPGSKAGFKGFPKVTSKAAGGFPGPASRPVAPKTPSAECS